VAWPRFCVSQVAVRDNAAFARQSTQLLLFTSPLLQ
jgi:hypothetical protein